LGKSRVANAREQMTLDRLRQWLWNSLRDIPERMTTAERLAVPDPDNHRFVWDTDLQEAYYWDGAWLPMGSGGGTVPVFVWGPATTWASIYAGILTYPASIVLVPNDGTPRQMTPNPGGETDLSRTWFLGFVDTNGAAATIDIDSALVGGFELSHTNSNIQSKNIRWRCWYRIGGGFANPTWTFDGGGFSLVAGLDAFRAPNPRLVLRNSAEFKGHAGSTSVFVSIVNASATVQHAMLGNKSFSGYAGPPAPILTVRVDDDSTLIAGFASAVIPTIVMTSKATLNAYDDSLVLPSIGADNVQDAIDYLKAHGGHEIIVDGASMPQEPALYFRGVQGEDEPIDGWTIVYFPRRVTTAQRIAMGPVFAGYTVFDTDLLRLATYDGTAWRVS
jgi:hypothetical protein